MAKSVSFFACTECGTSEAKWRGQCPGCSEWNTMVEEVPVEPLSGSTGGSRKRGLAGSARSGEAAKPVALRDVTSEQVNRLKTGIGEFDRVLGGGIVPGSLVLIGGSPGIGKSTLTGMATGQLAQNGVKVLYVSGEESAAQIRLRAERLGGAALDVPVLAETDLDAVIATIGSERPQVAVIDSVQTLYCADLTGAPGSVGQVREVAARLMRLAKTLRIAIVLVGHVTKEGALAGPRVLEHLVDTVIQFEGDNERTYRTLRALKNRFGSTNELGVFEMRDSGLVEVLDASARFIGEATGAPGSVLLAAMEGSRPLLVEVQALVAPTDMVPPRRVANGIDRNRLALVLAVLSRHAGVHLGASDVFVSVAGGVRIDEPAVDLALALALVSAARGESIGLDQSPVACFGEIGLTGEIRDVSHADRRLTEAEKFGIERVIGPPMPGDRAGGAAIGAKTVKTALQAAFAGDSVLA